MFLDASAIIAAINREPGYAPILAKITAAQSGCALSPLSRFEVVIALARQGIRSGRKAAEAISEANGILDEFAESIGALEITVPPDVGRAALVAAGTYGKLTGHPARLNFGDCFSYACAKTLGVGLIYKGDDFAHTDLA